MNETRAKKKAKPNCRRAEKVISNCGCPDDRRSRRLWSSFFFALIFFYSRFAFSFSFSFAFFCLFLLPSLLSARDSWNRPNNEQHFASAQWHFIMNRLPRYNFRRTRTRYLTPSWCYASVDDCHLRYGHHSTVWCNRRTRWMWQHGSHRRRLIKLND